MSNSIVENYEKHLAIINKLYSSYATYYVYSFSFIFTSLLTHSMHSTEIPLSIFSLHYLVVLGFS